MGFSSNVGFEETPTKKIERRLTEVEKSIRKLRKKARQIKKEVVSEMPSRCRKLYEKLPKQRADEECKQIREKLLNKILDVADKISRLVNERTFLRLILTLLREDYKWGVAVFWYRRLEGKVYSATDPTSITARFKNYTRFMHGVFRGPADGEYLREVEDLDQGLHHLVLDVHGLKVDEIIYFGKSHLVCIFLRDWSADVTELAKTIKKIVEEKRKECVKEHGCREYLSEDGVTRIECDKIYKYRDLDKCSVKRVSDGIAEIVRLTYSSL